MRQNEAFNLMKMGKNIFLTGEAGSGKTYLLNKYINYLKENNISVAVTASTGIAATHLQGVTIHSWSGIGVRDYLTEDDLEKLLTNKNIKRNYSKTKVLIIDEISMLHKHQLEMIDTIARYILKDDKAFGGIQVIVCGDFFQLPPVSSQSPFSEKQFAFEALAWQAGDFHVCYLQEQHRQADDPLYTILKDIRSGNAGEQTKIPLRTRYKKEPQGATKATKLFCRNINVDSINERELANINGKEKTYTMTTIGFSTAVEGLKRSCVALVHLKIKIGAEVLFIKNDQLGRYTNGTRGVVIGFERYEEYPVVKTFDNQVITAYPVDWKYEDNGIVRASITQVPLRLAWAITIHKSQGMTLDAAEIDLGDAFEPGMGYVALSRVRRLDGLKLMNLNEMALSVNPKILQHDQIFRVCSAEEVKLLQNLSEKEIDEIQKRILLEKKCGKKSSTKTKKIKSEKIPTHLITLAMLKDNMSVEMIAKERELSNGTILYHLEKLKSLEKLDALLLSHLKQTIPAEVFDLIFDEFKKSEDGKLTPIYEKFAGKFSYSQIQLVRLFMRNPA